MISEFDLIRELVRELPKKLQGKIGIGDDAGILRFGAGPEIVFSTDAIVEDVDFRMKMNRPEWVGRKALAVNLSDMAAMGARPLAFVIALGVSPRVSLDWIKRFYRGLTPLMRRYGLECLGGDVSRSKTFFASVSMIGKCCKGKAILRSGARPGDWIGVTGRLGGSILRHQFLFTPRVDEAVYLAENFSLSSMIDISDGLAQDLEHILKSSGVFANVDATKIPVSRDAVKLSRSRYAAAFHHAVSDGEDFELLFTVPQREQDKLDRAWGKRFPAVPLSWIGRIQKGKPRIEWKRGSERIKSPLIGRAKGFAHF